MRMAPYELRIDSLQDIFDVELVLFLAYPRMQHQLHHNVPQFFAQLVVVSEVDRFQGFVAFLNEMGFQREVSLLAVPGAAAGLSQSVDDINQGGEAVEMA